MEHQEHKELLELPALDALDEAEKRALDEHLAACAECRAELVSLRDAASLLAHGATPVAPRDELRAQILAAVRNDALTQREDKGSRVVPLMQRRPFNLWPNALKIAAVVAFAALAIGLVVLWRRDVRMRRDIARLTHDLNTQQRQLARERDARSRERDALALLSSPDAKKMELAGTQVAQNARATFFYDPKSGRAVLMTEGLPAAPADKAYELWFIPKDHSPMPGKMFTVDANGRATSSDQIPQEAGERMVIAITLEPKRGVAVPTGAIYLSSKSS